MISLTEEQDLILKTLMGLQTEIEDFMGDKENPPVISSQPCGLRLQWGPDILSLRFDVHQAEFRVRHTRLIKHLTLPTNDPNNFPQKILDLVEEIRSSE